MSSKQGNSLSRNSATLIVARTIAYACAMVLPIVLVRMLPLRELGIYKQVFVAINSLTSILPLGFSMSAYYYLPRFPDRRPAVVGHIFLFTLGMGAAGGVLVTLFPGLLEWAFHEPELRSYAPAIGLTVMLWISGSVLEAIALANNEVRLSAVIILTSQLCRTILLLAAAVLVHSVTALLAAAILQGMLQLTLLLWYMRSRFPGYWKATTPAGFRAQLLYALPYGLAGLAYVMTTDFHNYSVSRTYGAELFAIYSTGCFQVPLIGVLGESVAAVILPRISLLQSQNRHEEIIQSIARAIGKLALVYFPIFFFLQVAAKDLIVMLFSKSFLLSVPVFRINLVLILLNLFLLDPVSRAYQEFRMRLLMLNVGLAILMIGALSWGVPRFGLTGAIGIVVGVALFGRLALLFLLKDTLHLRWHHLSQLRRAGLAALAAAASGLLAALMRQGLEDYWSVPVWIRFPVVGCVFVIGYLITVYFLRAIEPDEIAFLRRWARLPAARV